MNVSSSFAAGISLLALMAAAPALAQETAKAPASEPKSEAPATKSDPADTKVEAKSHTVQEITVTARRLETQSKIDRRIYDIRTTADAAVAPAQDVISKLPGVFMTARGVPTIQGSTAAVFIDGKPAPRDIANQLPASQIESLEVITNPSAEFGNVNGPIINIVTKRPNKSKTMSSYSVRADTLGNYNANINRTFASDKGMVFFMLGAQGQRSIVNFDLKRDNFPVGKPASSLSQVNDIDGGFYNVNGMTRFARNLDKTTKLTGNLFVLSGQWDGKNGSIEQYSTAGSSSRLVYHNEHDLNLNIANGRIGLEGADAQKKWELFVSGNATDNKLNAKSVGDRNSRVNTKTVNDTMSLNGKLEQKLSDTQQINLGFDLNSQTKRDRFDSLNVRGQGLIQTNDFHSDITTVSLWSTYKFQAFGFGVMPGLRFDHLKGDFKNLSGKVADDYGYSALLPSLHLTKKVSDTTSLTASYTHKLAYGDDDRAGGAPLSLKIDAMTAPQQDPFLRYNGPYEASEGNPYLKPAKRDNFEIGYEYIKQPFSVLVTAYHHMSTNDMNDYNRLGEGGVVISKVINIGDSSLSGVDATVKGALSPQVTWTVNLNANHTELTAPAGLAVASKTVKFDRLNGKVNLEYQQDKSTKWTLNVTRADESQGINSRSGAQWSTNLQYSKRFQNKVSLVVDLVDIGATEAFTIVSSGPDFRQVYRTGVKKQALRIGLSQQF